MDVIGVIPARYGSTRFEGKVLADLCGKPMLQHVWERANESKALEELIVATDDERVEQVARGFGAKVVLTSKDHKSGSDRLTEVAFSLDAKFVVNIQADEPLIRSSMIDMIVDPLLIDEDVCMATMAKRIDDPKLVSDPNIVKVVFDRNGFALYFSRSVIPYPRFKGEAIYYKHMGMYAYTKDFLYTFVKLTHSHLEKAEGLEQLRVLEAGHRIKVVKTDYDTLGVDTPEDLEKARQIMAEESTQGTRESGV